MAIRKYLVIFWIAGRYVDSIVVEAKSKIGAKKAAVKKTGYTNKLFKLTVEVI